MSSEYAIRTPTSQTPQHPDHRLTVSDFAHYFSKNAEDDDQDSDEEDGPEPGDRDNHEASVVGVSFSREQKRLTLPSTPAADKAAALLRGDSRRYIDLDRGDCLAGHEESPQESPTHLSFDGAPTQSTPQLESLPSPVHLGNTHQDGSPHNKPERSSMEKMKNWAGLEASLQLDRLRDWTGLSDAKEGHTASRLKTFQLPALPRFSLAFSDFDPIHSGSKSSSSTIESGNGNEVRSSKPCRKTSRRPNMSTSSNSVASVHSSEKLSNIKDGDHDSQDDSTPQMTPEATPERQSRPGFFGEPHSAARRKSSSNTITPREESTKPPGDETPSEHDLALQRTLSITSSLGDDERWTDVHEQINSRMKAIKDSFIDSNIKFRPRMPGWSVLNFGAPWHHHEPEPDRRKSKQYWEEEWDTRRASDPARSDASQPSELSAGFSPTTPRDPTLSPPPPGMTKASAAKHPHFVQAVKNLTGDVVILGGYRGSILRSAEAPHRQLWVPIKVGLNLRKVNMEVGLMPEDEEKMTDSIIPGGMLTHIGPVDISRRLFKRLRASRNAAEGRLRVWNYGYDWRLSPHRSSDALIKFLEGLPSNHPDVPAGQRGAIVIAHSLGGLITRHAINRRPELFSGVLYAGVPQRCVNILGPLRNGDDVLFSSRVLTAQVNFSIRTSFALLPLDGFCFINRETEEEYKVDFFDPKTWDEYRLSPCVSRPILPQAQPSTSTVTFKYGLVGAMVSALPGLVRSVNSSRSIARSSGTTTPVRANTPPPKPESTRASPASRAAHAVEGSMESDTMSPQMGHNAHGSTSPETNVATAVTLAKDDAMAYLRRVLPEIKRFKQELAHDPAVAEKGLYPPAGVIYGKSVPTVYGANVRSREAIKHADAYDELAFASGDGVVLSAAAQIPAGYEVARGGRVSSDRGHLSLLGDLEAVGRSINAILAERDRRRRRAGAVAAGGRV